MSRDVNLPAEDPLVREQAAERTNIPGTLLVVCGLLNLLMSLFFALRAVHITFTPLEEIAESLDKIRQLFPGLRGEQSPAQVRLSSAVTSWVLAGLILTASVVMIGAGVRMRALRSYGLAVTGSILTALPCISCTSCCGLGTGIGLWSLYVLLSTDVREAFR